MASMLPSVLRSSLSTAVLAFGWAAGRPFLAREWNEMAMEYGAERRFRKNAEVSEIGQLEKEVGSKIKITAKRGPRCQTIPTRELRNFMNWQHTRIALRLRATEKRIT